MEGKEAELGRWRSRFAIQFQWKPRPPPLESSEEGLTHQKYPELEQENTEPLFPHNRSVGYPRKQVWACARQLSSAGSLLKGDDNISGIVIV